MEKDKEEKKHIGERETDKNTDREPGQVGQEMVKACLFKTLLGQF